VKREWLEKDYYEILGVGSGATDREITRSYRNLAKRYHPDNNPGDTAAEERFKEISEAYSVLSSERDQYDQARDMFAKGTFVGGPGGSAQYVRIDDLSDLGDLFGGGLFGGLGDLFGFGTEQHRRPPSQPGRDMETDISLTFHEAVQGVTRSIETGPGGRKLTVKVPPGVADGSRIRLRAKGAPGARGGPAGDLYVRVHVGTHPVFQRSGKDLKITVPVSYAEATLGANISVPTLDGKVTLRVPPGTASGRTLRVSGRGIETPRGRGDLLVTINVVVPDELSPKARALVEELRQLESDKNLRAHLGV
jgi:molecular chaperone DnaJ